MSSNDIKQQVTDILEATAPHAARRLADSVKYGENLKKDQAYEASLEILDRLGFTKKTDQSSPTSNLPTLPNDVIAGALSFLAKMFSVEPEVKQAASQIDVTNTSQQSRQVAPRERAQDKQPSPSRPQKEPVPEENDTDDIPFTVSPGLKERAYEND